MKLLPDEFYRRVAADELPMVVQRPSDGICDIASWYAEDPDSDPLRSEDHHHGAAAHVTWLLRNMRAASDRAVKAGTAKKPGRRRIVGMPAFFHDPYYEGGEIEVALDEDGRTTETVNLWARAYRRVHELGSQVFFSFDGGPVGREPRYLSVNPHKEYGAFDADPDERIKRMIAYIAEMDAGRFEEADIPNALDDAD